MKIDLVISGFAGRFANCDNLDELAINLYNKKDCITEDDLRWPKGIFDLPSRAGKLKHLGHFNREYFGISEQDANYMDPQMRILLELTFEAFCDSGTNPDAVRGENIGVFIATDISESEHANMNRKRINESSLPGTHKSLFSNKISYYFDLRGPSYTIINACSSSAIALHQAFMNIQMGKCESAIVGGAQITLNPLYAASVNKMRILSPDGKCKFLGESANGYVRSEACSVMYIQKASQAKRNYANIINISTNCDGYRFPPNRPSYESQANLMVHSLEEVKVDPNEIVYVEAHGTGTYRGDQSEIIAIDKAFCQNRKHRLMIGSVKTNLGHTEPASAMCQIAKVILTFESGTIPASLITDKYNNSISDIIKSKFDPVMENRIFKNGIVAINSFNLGGTNVVILLGRDVLQQKKNEKINNTILPLIVPLFSRTEEGIVNLMDYFERNVDKLSIDLAQLYYEICNVAKMNYRGFFIKLPDMNDEINHFHKSFSKSHSGKLVFVYPGLYSNMVKFCDTTRLSLFKEFKDSLEKSKIILREKMIDLEAVYSSDKLSDYIICHVVLQIALVDLMKSINVKPEINIFSSLGQIGYAYANSLIDQYDAITMIIPISIYFRVINDKSVHLISIDEFKDINQIISENIKSTNLNFPTIERDQQPIFNHLSQLYLNYYEGKSCLVNIEKTNIIEQYSIIEMALTPVLNALQFDDQIEFININKNRDLYHGILECMGKLFLLNFPINFTNIFSNTKYPVRRRIPSLHSLINWDHTHDYFVAPYTDFI